MIPDYVVITGSVAGALGKFIQSHGYSHVSILCDENSRKYCYPIIGKEIPEHQLIEIQSGEEHKNLATCEIIWSNMTDHQFDRNSLLVNLARNDRSLR